MYKACIFDLDGTLINSLEDLADSCNYALEQMGFPIHDVQAYRHFVGNGVVRLIENIVPQGSRTPSILNKTLDIYRIRYGEHYLDKTKPYSGIAELLKELKTYGIKLAVVSNKPNDVTKKIILELFGEKTFDIVFGQREGVPRKPHPQGALNACEHMHVQPQQCVFLGDSAVDMQTAIAAGMFPVGALWGFRDREELETAGAAALLGEPIELLKQFTIQNAQS
jgi:phosphoglycolate phosphatase